MLSVQLPALLRRHHTVTDILLPASPHSIFPRQPYLIRLFLPLYFLHVTQKTGVLYRTPVFLLILLQTITQIPVQIPERHRCLPEGRRTDPLQIIAQIHLSSLRICNPFRQHDILFPFRLISRRIIGSPAVLFCSSAHTPKNPLFCICFTVSSGSLVTVIFTCSRLRSSPGISIRESVMFGSCVRKT